MKKRLYTQGYHIELQNQYDHTLKSEAYQIISIQNKDKDSRTVKVDYNRGVSDTGMSTEPYRENITAYQGKLQHTNELTELCFDDIFKPYGNLMASTDRNISLMFSDITSKPMHPNTVDTYETEIHRDVKSVHVMEDKTDLYSKNKATDPESKTTHWAASASLVSGIIGFFFFPLSVAAIILSSVALRKIKNNPEKYTGRRTARAGLILGVIGAVLFTTAFLFVVLISHAWGS